MPFGLKNVGATYQKLVNLMFAEQIGKSMEVYVDPHITNLFETFTILKRFISKVTDICAYFFKTLKGSKNCITWTDECDEAFKNLNEYMSKAPYFSNLKLVTFSLSIYLFRLQQSFSFSFEWMVVSNNLSTTLVRPYKMQRHDTPTLRN
ncbi:hypothetical protein FF2_033058 [Malus domestica]